MTADSVKLPVVPIPGLPPDSLGNYLASIGLLRSLARKWPSVRIAWRDNALQVVGGPSTLGELCGGLMCIAAKRAWTPYERGWADAQKKSTKAKSGRALALWQASAEECTLELFTAHAVPAARISFNPILGSGGNAGKRDFSDGWEQAIDALAAPIGAATKKVSKHGTKTTNSPESAILDESKRKHLEIEALLLGKPMTWMLEKLNAASWFSNANKLYNSGQEPYREGFLSPWAMALACEGLAFLGGGVSRRLGARAYAVGAFPFVTRAAAPNVSEEAGRDLAEVWAPIWERPMTVPEVRALFARGRAEVQGRGVLTPSAFATAIVRRGVDAGILEFRRFILGRTTSANTFEPRCEGVFRMPRPAGEAGIPLLSASPTALSTALRRLLDLVDRLPNDRKVGGRWRFVGLRGPIEGAMLRLVAVPEDPEATRAVLDAVVSSLDRIDRNRSFREARVSWEPLPVEWLPSLFTSEAPSVEARLAMAMVSAFPVSRPFTLYRFGVDWKGSRFEHSERPAARWVWGPGLLPRVLSDVLNRRTLDWESARKAQRSQEEPVRLMMPATRAHVSQWLDGIVDERLLAQWTSRLALFDWRWLHKKVRALAQPSGDSSEVSAALCLFGLFQPLFDQRPVKLRSRSSQRDVLDFESGARTPGVARTLAASLRAGQLDAAVHLASNRYAIAGTPLSRMSVQWNIGDPERLLASLLFTVAERDRTDLIERWLRPQRQQGDEAHA